MLGHKVLTWYFLITMYFNGGMAATYLLYKDLNLINNPLVMVVTGGLSIYNMIVTRTYFANSIPESLYEAGRIDGSSEFGLFFRIADGTADGLVKLAGIVPAFFKISIIFCNARRNSTHACFGNELYRNACVTVSVFEVVDKLS